MTKTCIPLVNKHSQPANNSHFVMFFKFNSIYRQFSQISLRLITRKLITNTGNSLPLSSLTSSPLRNGKRNRNRIGIMTLRPTPFGIITIERPEPKLKYSTKIKSNAKDIKKENVIPYDSELIISEQDGAERSLDLMFPFLTGEELKAFDSSVYE